MESLWSDRVHLTDAGYKMLVESILEAREELKVKRKGDKLEENPASKKPHAEVGAAPTPQQREQSAGARGQQGKRGQHYTQGPEGGRGDISLQTAITITATQVKAGMPGPNAEGMAAGLVARRVDMSAGAGAAPTSNLLSAVPFVYNSFPLCNVFFSPIKCITP
jgi:hypothetical protein